MQNKICMALLLKFSLWYTLIKKRIQPLLKTEKLGMITKKLPHISRYKTREYLQETIFDIDKSSEIK